MRRHGLASFLLMMEVTEGSGELKPPESFQLSRTEWLPLPGMVATASLTAVPVSVEYPEPVTTASNCEDDSPAESTVTTCPFRDVSVVNPLSSSPWPEASSAPHPPVTGVLFALKISVPEDPATAVIVKLGGVLVTPNGPTAATT
jgi:hypothetical protein